MAILWVWNVYRITCMMISGRDAIVICGLLGLKVKWGMLWHDNNWVGHELIELSVF